ncbi:Alpha 1,3 fucosyltransferase 7 [Porites harrisoni]
MATSTLNWSKYFFLSTCGFSVLLLAALNFYDIPGLKVMRLMSNFTADIYFENNSHSLKFHHPMDKFMVDRNNMTTTVQPTEEERTKTVILVYTKFFGTVKWIGDGDNCGFENKFLFASNKCLSGDFELIYDKQRFEESDLVVFHARNMPSVDHLRTLLKSRPTSQRWVYALWETPNATPDPAPLNGLFNSTWTYRSDSDFLSPYGSYEELSEEEKVEKMKNIPDYSQGKTELVAWMVGNCGAQPRMAFVQNLKKYIKVDMFGGCSGKRCSNPPSDCLKKFKFYLSFENVLCEDYITEKYWGRLGEDLNVVPIVMGGANYSKLAIPGSYINVMDFKTVKQFAEYLQYLDKNNTAYNEYFKWRLKYKVFRSNLDLSMCQICKWYVSRYPLKPKVYDDLAAHWVEKGRCNVKNSLITSMWED